MERSHERSPVGAWLGYLGLIPFAAFALDLLLDGPIFRGFSLQGFIVYSAVILAFLGGVRWGAALNLSKSRGRHLLVSVIPPLWAAVALLLPSPSHTLWTLALGFLVFGLLDVQWRPPASPRWLATLRAQLTLAVLVLHGITLYAVA